MTGMAHEHAMQAAFVGSVWWHTGGNFNGCIDSGAFMAALAVMDEHGDATPSHVPGSEYKYSRVQVE
jgi:hypothetical protein